MDPASRTSKPDFPWWLVVTATVGLWLFWQVLRDGIYAEVLAKVAEGIGITVFVTVAAFLIAAGLGLMIAVLGMSRHLALRQAARLYVEIFRGIPALVLLFYVAFAAAPALVAAWNALGLPEARTRDFPFLWRAIIALALAYSPFIAEVFRAGIQAVDRGQVEAAKSLGLHGWLRFRHIVFPQAIRTILPPLGNDFVALVKDSSLVSVVGVADITQLGKVYAAGSFRYFETYNIVAFVYLFLTINLSLALRGLERRLRQRGQPGE